jgi:hypothetical protein
MLDSRKRQVADCAAIHNGPVIDPPANAPRDSRTRPACGMYPPRPWPLVSHLTGRAGRAGPRGRVSSPLSEPARADGELISVDLPSGNGGFGGAG